MRSSPNRRHGRAAGARGLTLVEVILASSVLAVAVLALMSASSTTSRSISENSELVIAQGAAHDAMEELLRQQWVAPPGPPQADLISRYNNFLSGLQNTFTVKGPGLPPGNTYGRIVVREPTAAEAPAYNQGRGPKRTTPWTGAAPLPPSGPSLLLITVTVNIPARPGKSATSYELRSLRSFL